MTLEIGFQKFPSSAIGSTKAVRNHETERSFNPQDQEISTLGEISEKKEESNDQKIMELQDTVTHLNESVQELRRELKFSVDEESGRVVVKVINAKDGEMIRQIPAEEILQLARRFSEGEPEGRLLKVIA